MCEGFRVSVGLSECECSESLFSPMSVPRVPFWATHLVPWSSPPLLAVAPTWTVNLISSRRRTAAPQPPPPPQETVLGGAERPGSALLPRSLGGSRGTRSGGSRAAQLKLASPILCSRGSMGGASGKEAVSVASASHRLRPGLILHHPPASPPLSPPRVDAPCGTALASRSGHQTRPVLPVAKSPMIGGF